MAQRLPTTCSMVELTGLGYAYGGEEGLKEKVESEINAAYKWYWNTFPNDHPNVPACIYCKGAYGDDDLIDKVLKDRGFQKVMEYPTPHRADHNVYVYILPGEKRATA